MSTISEKIAALDEALIALGMPYAFGGAQALAYGVVEPRATHDIDINIFVSVERVDEVLAGLPPGVAITPDQRERLQRDGQVRLWWDDTAVDLFFSTVPFHDAAARRVRTVPFGARNIPVLSPTDLAVCKAMFARGKDWVDIEAMRDAGSINPDEALRWVADMLGPDHPTYSRLEEILLAEPTPVSERDELPPGLRPPGWRAAGSDEPEVRPPTG